NESIGVHVPGRLPQFGWLPFLIAGGAALGLAASLLSVRFRRGAIGLACGALAAGLLTAAVQAKFQMHDIGHKRDQRTVLAGMHDFTPPFLGTSKIAQFTVTSNFGLGAWLIGAAMSLQIGAAWASRKTFAASVPSTTSTRKCCCKETIETGQFAYQI